MSGIGTRLSRPPMTRREEAIERVVFLVLVCLVVGAILICILAPLG
jgi:hypothetical protein